MRTRERRLTYREVGATAHELPDGYHHLQRSRVLGTGGALFEREIGRASCRERV